MTLLLILCLICLWEWNGQQGVGASRPCAPREYGRGKLVCVCNATYCDTVDKVFTINSGEFVTFISSKEGLRFRKTIGKLDQHPGNTTTTPSRSWLSRPAVPQRFTVNRDKKYQTIFGFGGAFSDAAGINILSLDKAAQNHLLRSYFSEEGIEYNLCRVPIGGTDFSTHPYSYDDEREDPLLEHFSLAVEDLKYKIPLIQAAKSMSGRDVHLIAATWSPPPWMKTNNEYVGRSSLKEQYYDTYAKFHLRFLDEYKKHDLTFWAISSGNEPMVGVIPVMLFNSLGWTPQNLANWVANYLGPQLRSSQHKDTLLLGYDDQRPYLMFWIDTMVKTNEDFLRYIDGFGVHWYLDFLSTTSVINKLHSKFPDKFILYSESCLGYMPMMKHIDFGSWERAEKYLKAIIQNMNTWVTAWVDWSMVLDLSGGPNWSQNKVDSMIMVNSDDGEFYKQPLFYAMGHVSKFVERGASRVQIAPTLPQKAKGLYLIAFENPDGRIVVVILNKNKKHTEVVITIPKKGLINVTLPAQSFATILC